MSTLQNPLELQQAQASTKASLLMTRRSLLCASGAALAGLSLAACGNAVGEGDATKAAKELDYSNWDDVLAAAKGQEVSWYGWGGSDKRNAWLADVLVPRLKEKYDVTLNVVGMDINDILTQLSGEMQAGTTEGSIDFIWINGENFASAHKNNYLWGPFVDYLPNYRDYVDGKSADIAYDFGSPTEGYEAPYGKAQMVFWVDGAKFANPPKNPDEFMQFCQEHPGQVSYPEPGDFTGTAFISCIIAGVIGKDKFEILSRMPDATEDEVRQIVAPGIEFLRSLNPYLWSKGASFPSASTTLTQMYQDGELIFGMGYSDPQPMVDKGQIATTTKTFIFDTGTVGNTNYMAIASNAPHKAAALVAINEVMSPEMQQSQYENLGNITVLDMDRLSDDQRASFNAVPLKSAQLALKDQLAVRVSEAAGPVIPVLEKIWHDEVPGK